MLQKTCPLHVKRHKDMLCLNICSEDPQARRELPHGWTINDNRVRGDPLNFQDPTTTHHFSGEDEWRQMVKRYCTRMYTFGRMPYVLLSMSKLNVENRRLSQYATNVCTFKVEIRRVVWLCLGKPSLWENLFIVGQRWMMLKDVEAVLGSDKEDRLCFIYFLNLGSAFLFFLGRVSGDNW